MTMTHDKAAPKSSPSRSEGSRIESGKNPNETRRHENAGRNEMDYGKQSSHSGSGRRQGDRNEE